MTMDEVIALESEIRAALRADTCPSVIKAEAINILHQGWVQTRPGITRLDKLRVIVDKIREAQAQ